MEEYFKYFINNDCLICEDSYLLTKLIEKLYLDIIKFKEEHFYLPKIILNERQSVHFLAGFIAACRANCPVFLCNPDWGKQEWLQVFDLIKPDIIWGIEDIASKITFFATQDNRLKNRRDKPLLHQLPWMCKWRAESAKEKNREKLVITERVGSKQPASKMLVHSTGYANALHKINIPHAQCPMPNAQCPQIMIPTGGSSGKIKFAVHTWDTLTASVRGFREYFEVDKINSFCVLPLYHVSGLMQFMRCFITGGKLVILPFKKLEYNQKYNTNHVEQLDYFISLVPTQLERLLQKIDLTQWLGKFSTVLLGGAPAWDELLQKARFHHIQLAPTYGMTETASQIATLKPEDFLKGKIGCGKVLPHAKVEIIAEKGEYLKTNQIGSINIKAESLALGYYPLNGEIQTCLQIDDLAFLDKQGYLHIVGRNSDKIITGGENVYPAEVEAAIRATQMVTDVCVIGVADKHWGEVVTAIYVPKLDVLYKDIQTLLKQKLSNYKIPKVWIPVSSLPRNSQGKINRQKLDEIAREYSKSLAI